MLRPHRNGALSVKNCRLAASVCAGLDSVPLWLTVFAGDHEAPVDMGRCFFRELSWVFIVCEGR